MKQNIDYKLSNPIYCQFWHHSYVQLEELPREMVSHILPYLKKYARYFTFSIFTNFQLPLGNFV